RPIGGRESFIIYDISNTTAPVEVAFIPGSRTVWRDMKSYGNYIYGIGDRITDGLLIVNMENAPNDITWNFIKPVLRAGVSTAPLEQGHNLYIDENGILYISGSNVGEGGVLMMDLKENPENPDYIGPATLRYSHDVFVRGDTVYSSDINDGFFSITDVSNKQAPELLAIQNTSRNFTHNSWLSDDGKYLFTTDERENAFVDAYDISDLENITRVDAYRPLATEGTGVLPHNIHYFNDFLVISYYSDGVKIVDARRPDNLIEVAGFDTTPRSGNGDGCWGVFPNLESGVLLASDMDGGLFILQPNYRRAAYFEGVVIDALTRLPLAAVDVEINSVQANFDRTRPDGQFKTGVAIGGRSTVTFSRSGYEVLTRGYTLENGGLITDTIELVPIAAAPFSGSVVDQNDQQGLPAVLLLDNAQESLEIRADENGRFNLSDLALGFYDVWVGAWGYRSKFLTGVDLVSNRSLNIELEPGIEDDFFQDLGWTTSSTARFGDWVRVEPIGTEFEGISPNPDADLDDDFGTTCYVTGNGAGGVGLFDVDNGAVTLTSPVMDLSTYESPEMQFSYWFFNGSGNGTPDDEMRITINNGITTVDLAVITQNTDRWQEISFMLEDFIELTSTVQLTLEVSDTGNPHLVEAGIDGFRVVVLVATNDVDLFAQNLELKVFPNPSYEQFNVEFSLSEDFNGAVQLNLYNQFGQQLSSRR
ncbi:MAG: choice-of-anchor B family protein, partial [Bacteroidota bacterium]